MNGDIAGHLKRAVELLSSAADLIATDHPADSISRSCYAAFHAATAVLLHSGIVRKSHHAVWAAFGELIAKTSGMEAKFHRYGLELFTSRMRSDYLAEPDDTLDDAKDE